MIIKTLFKNNWLAIKEVISPEQGVNGYSYMSEARKGVVAILPYRPTTPDYYGERDVAFLLRKEVTPCWGMDPQLSAITGSIEAGETAKQCAVKELKEEAGFEVTENNLIDLGRAWCGKACDTSYYLFAVDVSGLTQGDAAGDGSQLESEATTIWSTNPIWKSNDSQLLTMVLRLKEVLK